MNALQQMCSNHKSKILQALWHLKTMNFLQDEISKQTLNLKCFDQFMRHLKNPISELMIAVNTNSLREALLSPIHETLNGTEMQDSI